MGFLVSKVIYALVLEMLGSLVLEMTGALVLELVLEMLDSLVLEVLDSLVLEVLGFLKARPRSLASFTSTLFNRGLDVRNVLYRIFCDPSLSP